MHAVGEVLIVPNNQILSSNLTGEVMKELCENCKQANSTCPIYKETTLPVFKCVEFIKGVYSE